MNYDAQALLKFAEKLRDQANAQIASWTIGAGFAGMVIGYLVANAIPSVDANKTGILFLFACGAMGYAFGKRQSLEVRARAHTLLCAMEQEKHLRTIAESLPRRRALKNG